MRLEFEVRYWYPLVLFILSDLKKIDMIMYVMNSISHSLLLIHLKFEVEVYSTYVCEDFFKW